MEDKMPPKMHKKWIHNAVDTLKESLQWGERVSVDEVVIADGVMEIDVERDNNMTSEKQEAIYATCDHEAEDVEINTKAKEVEENEDIDVEMEPSGHLVLVPFFMLNIEHLLILVCTSSDPVASIPHTHPLPEPIDMPMLQALLFLYHTLIDTHFYTFQFSQNCHKLHQFTSLSSLIPHCVICQVISPHGGLPHCTCPETHASYYIVEGCSSS